MASVIQNKGKYMNNQYKKTPTKMTAKDVFKGLLVFAIVGFLRYGLYELSVKTNSPLVIMFDIINYSGFASVCQIYILAFLFNFKTWNIELRIKPCIILAAIIIGISLLLSLFHMSDRYGNIEVDNEKPSRLQYCCLLFSDAVNKNTVSVKMNSEDLGMKVHFYSPPSRGGGRDYNVSYFSFEGYSTLLYEDTAEEYVRACRKIGKDIEIEYYEKSGIIKTIDGIDLYDEERFDKAIYDIEKVAARMQNTEEMIKDLKDEKSRILFRVFFKSEGQDYKGLMADLKWLNVDYTYSTVYISTKYFETGQVAFFDNIDHVVYVVRDNDAEEMKVVPSLPHNGTLPEITKIFDENGIKWTFDCFGSFGKDKEDLDHSHDTLKTIQCSPGTPIPEDYVLWFSVDHVSE